MPGVGCHINVVPPDRLTNLYTIFQLETVTYLLSIPLAKLSILSLCYRLFRSDIWFRRTCYILFAIIAGYGFASLLTALFRCHPVGAAWSSPAKGSASCLSIVKLQVAVGWINIATDVALMVLPMPVLWRLNMPWQKKAGVAVLFATGAAVVAMSVARQLVLYKSLNGLDKDITWSAVLTHILFTLELNIAIICGCLPTMQPLFRRFGIPSAFRSVLTSVRQSGRSGSHTRTGSESKAQGSTGPPPPTWGSVPIRKKRPPATPTGEPAWTREWHWGLMNDEDDSPSGSGQGTGKSRYSGSPWRTPRSPWFPRMPGTPLSAPKQKNMGGKRAQNRNLQVHMKRGEGDGERVITPTLRSPEFPLSLPHAASRHVPSPLSAPWDPHSGISSINTLRPGSRSPILAIPESARIRRESTSSASITPSPTSIRFAPQMSQSQRLLTSSSRLHERRGRQSLDLGPLPSFRPPPLIRSSSDPRNRRKSEKDAASTPLSPRGLPRVKEAKEEGYLERVIRNNESSLHI